MRIPSPSPAPPLSPELPAWTDTQLCEVGERLHTWALDTVRHAQSEFQAAKSLSAKAIEQLTASNSSASTELTLTPNEAQDFQSGYFATPRRRAWAIDLDKAITREQARQALAQWKPEISKTQANKLLDQLRHPARLPHKPVTRVLQRWGVLDSATPPPPHQIRGFLTKWANCCSRPEPVLLLILRWLAGQSHSWPQELRVPPPAPCKTHNPNCPNCPVQPWCHYARNSPTQPQSPYSATQDASHAPNCGVKNLPEEERPREKLLAGIPVSTEELLAILIRSGTAKRSAIRMAQDLIAHFRGLKNLQKASPHELIAQGKLNPTAAATVFAALELGRRQQSNDPTQESSVTATFDSPQIIFKTFYPRFEMARAEQFMAVYLNVRLKLIQAPIIFQGTLDQTTAHPREVFGEALRVSAHRVVVIHNHPSGDPSPSKTDEILTKRFVEAGAIVGIPLMDHLIFGENCFFSFRESGKVSGFG